MLSSPAGRDAAYTPIDSLGNSINGAELEVGVEEMGEELLVEICNQSHEVIAMNSLYLSDLWEVSCHLRCKPSYESSYGLLYSQFQSELCRAPQPLQYLYKLWNLNLHWNPLQSYAKSIYVQGYKIVSDTGC